MRLKRFDPLTERDRTVDGLMGGGESKEPFSARRRLEPPVFVLLRASGGPVYKCDAPAPTSLDCSHEAP